MFGETMELYQKISPRMNIKDYEQLPVQIFEGAQGALLDIRYGFWPHVTKTDITFDNAYRLIRPGTEIKRIGVMRAHLTRHGRGPFITEDASLYNTIPDAHNGYGEWQEYFRIGWPDMVATRYALRSLGGVDSIALTNLDKLSQSIKVCIAYEYDPKRMRRGLDDIGYMDLYFENEKDRGVFTIHEIRKDIPSDEKVRQKLTDILFRCRPIYKNVLNKKIQKYSHMNFDETGFSDVERYHEYISFLESGDGLSTPISIVSYGPTRDKKCLIKDI
jgi:adenylosuccinate synthase